MNFLYVPIFIWGLLFGSFLNVIIYRLPRKLSIVFPGSNCPHCKSPIPLYRNIPLFSFIFQLGKCANCKGSISYRYPLIELLNGFLWMLNFQLLNFPNAIFSSILCSCLIAIIFIDYKHYIIPLPIITFSFLVLGINLFFVPEQLNEMLYGILLGIGFLGFVFISTSLILKKQAMGYGDLLLIAVLGAWLGPIKVLFTIFFGALLGIIFFGYKIYIKNETISKLPFGTFLGIASIIINFINIELLVKPLF